MTGPIGNEHHPYPLYTKPQAEQEPVAWQYRMRPDWGIKKDCWGPWQDCTMEQAAMYQRVPLLHDWAYESRQFYTHPQNLNCKSNQARLATLWGYTKEQPKREPLTDDELDKLCPQFEDPMRREMWKLGFKVAHNIKD